VNDDRAAQLMGQSDLLAEHLLLDVARREAVVIIEADFTNSTREWLRVDRLPHTPRRFSWIRRERPGVMRVHTDRESHLTPARSDFLRLPQLGLIVSRKDDKRALDAGRSRALDDLVEIGGKLRPGEFRDLTKREIDVMTAPAPQPKPQVRDDREPDIAERAPRATGAARGVAPFVKRREPVRAIAQRVTRRAPPARTRVGPVESARAGAPRVTRRGPRAAAGPAARFGAGPRTGRPAAAGNAARFAPRRRSTRAAAGRAAPRRGQR